jgi:hypothetical protein
MGVSAAAAGSGETLRELYSCRDKQDPHQRATGTGTREPCRLARIRPNLPQTALIEFARCRRRRKRFAATDFFLLSLLFVHGDGDGVLRRRRRRRQTGVRPEVSSVIWEVRGDGTDGRTVGWLPAPQTGAGLRSVSRPARRVPSQNSADTRTARGRTMPRRCRESVIERLHSTAAAGRPADGDGCRRPAPPGSTAAT